MRAERGLDRLVTFPDAIVAIAITLLVLPLVDLLAEGPRDDLAGLLRDHLADFGSFALSSVVIARLWLVHHRIGEWTGGYDTAFPWVNLFRAFTIVLLPFSSGVVAEYGTERLSVALYVGTITASSVPALRSAPRGHGRVGVDMGCCCSCSPVSASGWSGGAPAGGDLGHARWPALRNARSIGVRTPTARSAHDGRRIPR